MVNPVVERGSEHVLRVGFNRPEMRNALDKATVDALHQILEDHSREPTILIFHSTTPGMFVSGADIAELRERDADDALLAINAGVFERIEAHRWPTIAAIDGYALGGGCELALACDLRIATPEATFGQPELSLGITAGAGANWRLAQLCGIGVARRLLYTGAFLSGAEALAAGLVDELAPADGLLDAAEAMAIEISKKSWRALEFTKLALRQNRPATTGFDAVAQSLLFESEEKRERMDAFLSRRSNKSPGEKTT